MQFVRHLIILPVLLCFDSLNAQPEENLLRFEKSIDEAVVHANTEYLTTVYAYDFRFKHGTGVVDNKTTWLADVTKNKGKFLSRELTEVEVELHDDVGITHGKLTVTRVDVTYSLRYVRVYRMNKEKGQWQMIMHRTVQELHK